MSKWINLQSYIIYCNTTSKPLFQAPNAEDAVGQGEAASKKGKKKEKKERKMIRTAAGDVWEDSSLLEWDDNDFRYCLAFTW